MIDREKVLKGLECCLVFDGDWFYHCDECPYRATEDERKVIDWHCHLEELRSDALELLKAQESVEPILALNDGKHKLWQCGNCKVAVFPRDTKYCHNCGKVVKWDD